MLETIEADADRVTRLIGELLDISRIDAGRLEVRRQPVDLVAVANKHVERMVASGYDDERFVVQAPKPLPEVWADPDKLDQVLGNLLENAVRHGGGTVTLTVVPDGLSSDEADGTGGRRGPRVRRGRGHPRGPLPVVFTRFWHGRSRGGTGLGPVRRPRPGRGPRRPDLGRARPTAAARMFRFTLPAGAPEHLA